jgi:hypothetical protein
MPAESNSKGTVKWISSAIVTSLAAAAHEDYPVRPAVGHRARIQAWYFQVTGPVGAGAGTHDVSVLLTDGTNEIPLFQSDVVFNTGLAYENDTSWDTAARPELLDRALLPLLQNIILSNDYYLIVRYSNDTDVASTRARNLEICYIEF